ncbi:MAG TPA: HEAT repeat domain-containing protein [Candidatus Tumulicola sp.]
MIVVVIVIGAVAVGAAVALFLVRGTRRPVAAAPDPAGWTDAAGDEFAGLTEPARCELIFAIAALDDRRSLPVLERALADPSETVALAAAHALAARGDAAIVESYFAAHPGERATRIAGTLALLNAGVTPSS